MKNNQFENLKLALIILYSNYTPVLNEIRRYYNRYKMFNKVPNDVNITYGNFEIKIHNNYIGDIVIKQRNTSFIFSVNGEHFDCNYCRLINGTYNVHIDDVKDNTDWFSLSTIRDFYDVNYNDIEMVTKFMDDVNKIKRQELTNVSV